MRLHYASIPFVRLAFVAACVWNVEAGRGGEPSPGFQSCDPPASPCAALPGAYYAATAWPTLHRDARNSDSSPFVAPVYNRVTWTALDGAALLAGPTTGPEGHLYFTTGQGPGTSHLHAFDRRGNLLWKTAPQVTMEDLDSAAIASAPLIDVEGDLYLPDADQFWAFHSDGAVKWVVALPDPDTGMASSILTAQGLVGGITTNGKVLLYDRATGSLAVPVFELPGGPGLPARVPPDGLWANGLIDPRIVPRLYNAFYGFETEVANTPSVHPRTGRIYITASGSTPEKGVLYGLDVVDGSISIAFQAPMSGGSGTSPSIAPDGSKVYAVGGDRTLYAYDAETGLEVWRSQGAASAASPTVGADGTLFVGGREFLTAIDPRDGSTKWQVNYDQIAQSALHRILPSDAFPTGLPIARTNSVVSVSPTHVWVAFILGYEFAVPDSNTRLTQPHMTALASVNPADGTLIRVTFLRDTSEGQIGIDADGTLFVTHGSLTNSLFVYGIDPELPEYYQRPHGPTGGFSVLEPLSYRDHALEGLRSVTDQLAAGADALQEQDCEAVRSALCLAGLQLEATARSMESDTVEEIGPGASQEGSTLAKNARANVRLAQELLDSDTEAAGAAMAQAAGSVAQGIEQLWPAAQMEVTPGVCPKTLNVGKFGTGSLEVALAGSDDFDVRRVDLASLRLSRADGVGREVEPQRRRRGGWAVRLGDVTTASSGLVCDCEAAGADGILDRVIRFSRTEVVAALELGGLTPGTGVRLVLRGRLLNGAAFQASDCITIAGWKLTAAGSLSSLRGK